MVEVEDFGGLLVGGHGRFGGRGGGCSGGRGGGGNDRSNFINGVDVSDPT